MDLPENPALAALWPQVLDASSWALPPQSIPWLWNLLERLQPTKIVEVGSGISTLVFNAFLTEHSVGSGHIVSLDHDTQWMKHTQELLEQGGSASKVTFIGSEIVSQKSLPSATWSFCEPTIQSLRESAASRLFDFCLIDGPPAHQYGRAPTLPQLLPFIRQGGVIVLDDACRNHEVEVCNAWRRDLTVKFLGIAPVGHGFAVFQKR